MRLFSQVRSISSLKSENSCVGVPYGNRTRVAAVKGLISAFCTEARLQRISLNPRNHPWLFRSTLYNPTMNKRARKRLKEAIEKKNLERQKMLKEQSSASSQTKERRGFTVKPEKKRG